MADDNYTCSLDAVAIKKARAELHEIPQDRLEAAHALRSWLVKQPHIRSRTDTAFLLRILRYKKFSQLESRKAIETYWTKRICGVDWVRNIDTRDQGFQAALDCSYTVLLPGRTQDGTRVLMFDPGAFDLKFSKYTKCDMFKVFIATLDMVMRDELTQVHGMEFFVDLTNYDSKHRAGISMEDRRKLLAHITASYYPLRMKKMHFYNTGILLEWIMTIIRSMTSKKMQERMFIHGNSMEDVYKHIPQEMLPREYLPDDYEGPCAGTLQELLDERRRLLSSDDMHEYIRRETSGEFGIDESKRPGQDNNVTETGTYFRSLKID